MPMFPADRIGKLPDTLLKAVGVTLAEVASADLRFDDKEIRQIGFSLVRHTSAPPEKIFEIIAIGKANARMGVTSPLVEILTEVAMADGQMQESEKEKIREISKALGLFGDEMQQAIDRALKKQAAAATHNKPPA